MSFNVLKGGRRALGPVLDYLRQSAIDVVGLQEIWDTTVGDWRSALESAGYHVVDTFTTAKEHRIPHPSPMRADGLLIASRWPLRVLEPTRIEIAWPERLLSVIVRNPDQAFEFHTTHVPNGSLGTQLFRRDGFAAGKDRLEKKIDTLEAVYKALTKNRLMPRVLAGDFNEPFSESSNGMVQYYQHECPKDLRPLLQDRWRVAAHRVFEGLDVHGMQDAFRTKHGYEKPAHSWETAQRHDEDGKPSGTPNLYRLDHLFASKQYEIVDCDYDHSFRRPGLSDHAAIIAELHAP